MSGAAMRRLLTASLLLLSPFSAQPGFGETQRLRIPAQNGQAAVQEYITVLQQINALYLSHWARFHNGWGGAPPFDNCSHRNAHFLVWHHAYLVLTEELFAKVLGKSEFAMPYWSPVQGEVVPDVFSSPAGPSNPLFVPKRFPQSTSTFAAAHQKWNELAQCADSSFFCEFGCNGITEKALGGKSIEDGNNWLGGSVELWVHDPVHNAGCTNDSSPLCSPIGLPHTAARDPLFQPFHAGIDAGFVAILQKPKILCEVCSERFLTGTSEQEWDKVRFLLPEPRCLVVTGGQPVVDEAATYETGKLCSGLPRKPGNIPTRVFTVKEVLRDKRFWKIGYPGSQAETVIGNVAPCPVEGELENCLNVTNGLVSCPQLRRTPPMLLSRRFLWIKGDRHRGDKGILNDSFFQLRVEVGSQAGEAGREFSVMLESGDRHMEAGAVTITPWEMSLHEGSEHGKGHGGPILFELRPNAAVQEFIGEALAAGRRISAEVFFGGASGRRVGTKQVVLDILRKTP